MPGISSEEQYIVILFEKILDEFTEPFSGYFGFEVTIKQLSMDKLTNEEKIKFYFWVNVAGVTSITDQKSGQVSPVFKEFI